MELSLITAQQMICSVEEELFNEIKDKRNGKESNYLENLLQEIYEADCYDLKKVEKKYHCSIDRSIDKVHQLQSNFYYTITSPWINAELNLEVESGINNGTQMNSYSFEGDVRPETKTVEVLKDVILNVEKYKTFEAERQGFTLEKGQRLLNEHKANILKLHSNQSYDNYVTGGGTNVTDKHYANEVEKLRNLGLYWEYVYEEIEIPIYYK